MFLLAFDVILLCKIHCHKSIIVHINQWFHIKLFLDNCIMKITGYSSVLIVFQVQAYNFMIISQGQCVQAPQSQNKITMQIQNGAVFEEFTYKQPHYSDNQFNSKRHCYHQNLRENLHFFTYCLATYCPVNMDQGYGV